MKQTTDGQRPALVYKVVPNVLWQEALRKGLFSGSADDQRDGYIHLSTADQVAGTLERYYGGQRDLLLIAIETAVLGPALKFEPSRGDLLFPHFYGALPTSAAVRQWTLTNDAAGNPVIDPAWLTC